MFTNLQKIKFMQSLKQILKLSAVFFITAFYIQTFAQGDKGEIYGKVIDAVTKQPIPGANILLLDTNFGAAADEEGNFKLSGIPLNTYRIRASTVGYESQIKTDIVVNPTRPANLIFELRMTVIDLEGVTVSSGYFSKDPSQLISTQSFSYEEIRRSPGGFEDVIRALSVLPGVALPEAGRNDLIVRGGAPSENLYLVDGIEIPNINHFGTQGAGGGPLSYINLDYVKETQFSTGGFPVNYGDKLSSVLRIDLRTGREDRLGGKATISATQFGLNLEGPLSDNSDFIFSARRSYLDFIFKAAGFGFVPEYYDLIAKTNYSMDKNNQLSFLFIGAFDNVKYFNDTEEKRFDNSRILGSDQTQYVAGITFRNLFNKGFYKIILSRNFVDYDSRQQDSLLIPIFLNKSLEQENTLRGDIVYQLSPAVEWSSGLAAKLIKFNADIKFPIFLTSFGDTLPTNILQTEDVYYKAFLYTNVSFKIIENFTFNLGLRGDYFSGIVNELYASPRFSSSYKLTNNFNINFSSGIYRQFPSYIWIPSDQKNESLDAVRADHYILGFDYSFREDAQIKVEGFIKDYKNYPASLIRPYLVLANTGAGYSGAENNFSAFGLEPLLSEGYGLTRGVEFSIQKKLSNNKLYGILSTTLSETKFSAIDNIERIGSYDQTWLFNLSAGYKFSEEWEASMKFRFASGYPYTPFNPDGTQNISEYNSRRLEPNHALDLRVDKRWFIGNLTLITYIDVQNIYNKTNRSFIRWDPRNMKVDNPSSIGVLPTIGVSLEF
jgi:hypothetical protein